MKDSLLSRIGRIISASANSLIDSVENAAPSLILEEAIREVDQAIDEVRHELGKQEAAKHLTSKQLAKENEQHEQLVDQIKDAITSERDDLAEAAIARQMDIEAQIPVLERNIETQNEKITELNQFIFALQAKKREMEQNLRDFVQSQSESQTQENGQTTSGAHPGQQAERAQSTFDRVLAKSSGNPTRASNADAGKLAELEELSRNNRIRERLEALKAASE